MSTRKCGVLLLLVISLAWRIYFPPVLDGGSVELDQLHSQSIDWTLLCRWILGLCVLAGFGWLAASYMDTRDALMKSFAEKAVPQPSNEPGQGTDIRS